MANSDQIWCVFRSQAAMHITVLHRSWVGYICAHVCTYRCAPFPYLGNGWTDCAEMWFVVRDPLVWRFIKVNGGTGAGAHVRTHFPYSGTAGRIALQLGVWLGDHQLCIFQRTEIRATVQRATSTRATVNTFKHICLFPLVYRPTVLLVDYQQQVLDAYLRPCMTS